MLQSFSDIRSPFAALRTQLDGIPPGQSPIDLTIGAPRHPAPAWVTEKLTEAMASAGSYPPIQGSAELRDAMHNWAEKRFPALKGKLSEHNFLPLNGSREGLFNAIFIARSRRPDIEHPVVFLPNPYYQVYGAAALAAGATPWPLNAVSENGFLPAIEDIPEELQLRCIAFYICSPSNPEGAVATPAFLKKLIDLARAHDFLLFSDECYSEIYRETPPPSAIAVAMAETGSLNNICSFNSLSKRSNLPGIRSGLVMADEAFITAFQNFRNVAGPQIPGPIQHLSSHLWQEESHVEANRRLYNEKFALIEKRLSPHIPLQIPEGGFFLWLNLRKFGGGIETVTTLWKGCGVKLLPGAYLSQPDHTGVNPGTDYARMALVSSLKETEEAVQRLISVLG